MRRKQRERRIDNGRSNSENGSEMPARRQMETEKTVATTRSQHHSRTPDRAGPGAISWHAAGLTNEHVARAE